MEHKFKQELLQILENFLCVKFHKIHKLNQSDE